MRFHEFADPKDYAPTEADAEGFLNQVPCVCPDRLADEPASSTRNNRGQPPSKPGKLSDA
jgi:hypothetical protein